MIEEKQPLNLEESNSAKSGYKIAGTPEFDNRPWKKIKTTIYPSGETVFTAKAVEAYMMCPYYVAARMQRHVAKRYRVRDIRWTFARIKEIAAEYLYRKLFKDGSVDMKDASRIISKLVGTYETRGTATWFPKSDETVDDYFAEALSWSMKFIKKMVPKDHIIVGAGLPALITLQSGKKLLVELPAVLLNEITNKVAVVIPTYPPWKHDYRYLVKSSAITAAYATALAQALQPNNIRSPYNKSKLGITVLHLNLRNNTFTQVGNVDTNMHKNVRIYDNALKDLSNIVEQLERVEHYRRPGEHCGMCPYRFDCFEHYVDDLWRFPDAYTTEGQ